MANCPVLWQSKLQSKTVPSIIEVEVIALAHCCRILLPIIFMVPSHCGAVGLSKDVTIIHVSIHEDNADVVIFTESLPPQYTLQSKYCAIKIIWFGEEIIK